MATENRSWGYTRIQGALANLEHHVSRGAIAIILKQHGIEPAPDRQKPTTWQEFLCRHRGVLTAADFFSVEVWTAGGLTRFAVLFVIDVATRRVCIAGIVREPDKRLGGPARAPSDRMTDACAGSGSSSMTATPDSPTGSLTRCQRLMSKPSACRPVRPI
jgi:transposase InsO family protein